MDLRAFSFIDSLQPQLTGFLQLFAAEKGLRLLDALLEMLLDVFALGGFCFRT